MDRPRPSEFESSAHTARPDPATSPPRIGIAVKAPAARSFVQAASRQLGLEPGLLSEDELNADLLGQYELVVAEEACARHLCAILSDREKRGEAPNPALVAVRTFTSTSIRALDTEDVNGFDGVLTLPMEPGAAAAQLSFILHAHRASARRHQSVIDELHLNRRIFRSVTSGISVADATQPDMPLTYVNPAFVAMTGYAFEEVKGKNCRFLQGSDSNQPGVVIIREAIQQQREVTAIIRNVRKDGTAFWNELSLSPIRNLQGELTHFVGIQNDVTARVEFEAALRQSEKLAAVGRLASSIAHEINNPLESVMNLLFLAQQAEHLQEAVKYLAQADQEVRRVALITSQSLRFYRQSTNPVAVHFSGLLDSVLDLYQSRVENSRVLVERRERSRLSFVCLESEIRHVLNNLIRNAIEAMHGRGGRLLIRTRDAVDQRSGTPGVVLTVADTGTGISPQAMEQLYKPFFTTKGAAGTGLGLWISSEIVERHLGRLRARSRQSGDPAGTIFTLFLPLQTIAVAASAG